MDASVGTEDESGHGAVVELPTEVAALLHNQLIYQAHSLGWGDSAQEV
jgi:hypothetical protein